MQWNGISEISDAIPEQNNITEFQSHYENTPIQIYTKFHLKNMKKFR